MASEEKFTNDAMCNMLRHNNRTISNHSNKDIDPARSVLNYSFPMDHGGLSDYKYYKKLVGENYLYGRGSKREKDAVTGCGWVITAPKEIVGDPDKERAFFQASFDFVGNRYGSKNIINNVVHYDEGGSPHIHIVFCPVTTLNHEKVQFKTVNTKSAVRLESGRYEYGFRFKLDKNGERIPVKNYSRMTDYYDEKISANDVLNKIELRNFHHDLQQYLTDNRIEGSVLTGRTGGTNFTVKELKDFTSKTGLHLGKVMEMTGNKSLLESYADQNERLTALEKTLTEKNIEIDTLREELSTKDMQLKELEVSLAEKQKELEKQRNLEFPQTNKEQSWGRNAVGWRDGSRSAGWGRNTTLNEEKIW